ncbi:conserved uncharacterized protein, DUF323 [Desulfobacula toluolica Tol2]|uniref:Conserved uncharacterized protein, DUF323 n=2 Tax=Desulfobacula toluolica TaxID=28223 RepID=K0NPD8_DESTT|nr:conserved uncharacterized protein, DUF323 [Desulfobacula toluolica Tol2]
MVQKVMKNIKSKHVLLISDSCYSGTLFGRARAMPTVIDDKYYLNLYNEQSRWGMTSGNKTPVSDSGSRGHSVFAYQLIKKLEKNTRPYISTREIYTDIAPIIANNSDQSPLCNPIKGTGDMGGEFIFVAQGTTTITTPDVIVGSKGKLSIISDPEGADIFVGGKFKGRSPLDMDSIEPGDYRVKARLAGYDAIDKTVRVNSSRKAMVTFYFEKKETKGRLYVTTRPDGSIIKILNIKSGYVQGMELAAGQYTVRVSKTGYAPKTQTVRIAEGEGVDLYVELEKERVVSSEPGPGDTWTDPVTGMEFVWVPGGCFNMGQTQEEKQYLIKEVGKENYGKWYNDEVPRHEVCVDGFWMGKYEVTNGQYRRFKSGHDSKEYEGVNLNSSDQPLVMISWDYAKAFAKWLGREAGQSFVLPTEAQWEYAARGGTTTIRFWGDGPDQACRYANVHDVTSKKQFSNFTWLNHNCNDGFAAAAPVGSFLPNDFGLYDMLGNVWEWCEDVYDENAYSKHGRNNPVVISGGSSRVCRGGGWLGSPGGVRAAYRDGDSADSRLSGLGFRLCLPQVRQ